MQAKINFANGTSLLLNDADSLQPVILAAIDGKSCATLANPVELYWHMHDGLIPAIMDVLLTCDYFKVVGEENVVYGTKSVVSVANV